jgi:hypothetical protein
VRAFALALGLFVFAMPAAAATPPGLKLLVRDGEQLGLLYLDRPAPFTQPLRRAPYRPLAFSGDGRLISIGGTIVGRARLPTRSLVWAPTGERAAYITTEGGVVVWTPSGTRTIEPKGWGAQPFFGALGLAWARDGALAISRKRSIWVWRAGSAREVVGPVPEHPGYGGPDIPLPFAWSGERVLWFDWPGSGSVASDGVSLYAGDQRLGTTLMYSDYVAVCGTHIAFAQGRDRYSTDGKTLVFDGRDVSRDSLRSWTEPSCTLDGRLVAAASRNVVPHRTTETHRAIWQLLPTRRQLTQPPWGWSDESPHLFADGSLLFVRSRITTKRHGTTWRDTQKGRVMLLAHGKLRRVAEIGFGEDEPQDTYLIPYYGHYDWSSFLAVWP